MASLSDAFIVNTPTETENLQAYDEDKVFVHVKEARHQLGLVGGNAVSRAVNRVDVESDLLGITRPNSDAMSRHHLPPTSDVITRENPKINIKIDGTPVHLKDYQQWAYPSVIGPLPIEKGCHHPEKY